VVGGSLGAKVLNEMVPAALARIPAARRPRVVHQSGLAHEDAVRSAYGTLGVRAEVVPFIDDMPARLAACDVIICRAGAITVSELCAAGVASVLVPLIVSTTSHQRDNAIYMAEHGAARHLPQADLDVESLANLLSGLDRESLRTMAERARSLARPHAAARVADQLDRLVPAT
jgi:UDP-N-acetylglucosamine--N-acetylmuramyl-(pentapeptide) pyrophosphoryl-undecaprenol N-acetylglucosamine transferase